MAVLLPGVVLLFAGIWMVTDGGPLPLGWALFAVGLGLLAVGAVAWGVAWGLELHADTRRWHPHRPLERTCFLAPPVGVDKPPSTAEELAPALRPQCARARAMPGSERVA